MRSLKSEQGKEYSQRKYQIIKTENEKISIYMDSTLFNPKKNLYIHKTCYNSLKITK